MHSLLLALCVSATSLNINASSLNAHIRFLSSDLLEGRGPASRGDRLAQEYIATQMELLGLVPGAPDGSWFQPFEIVGITSHNPEKVKLEHKNKTLDLKFFEEFIATSGVEQPLSELNNAEIVFVGYGITAPEYRWDDYKGMDLRGKVLLMMNNDPENDPKLFAGKTRLYYGRWDYKYEMAAKAGAAGVFIIHTLPSAGYPWQVVQTSWTGEQFSLPDEGKPHTQVTGWFTENAAQKIVSLAGKNLDTLRASAQKRNFKPVPLGVSLNLALRNDVQKVKTANVIGKIPGADAVLSKQAVIYTAHHDHLGINPHAKPGEDAIYNGALDNASGVAVMLTLAQAVKSLPQTPSRTIYFAAVAAEEQGLLGSSYLASHLPIPAGHFAANINMDGINIWGRTKDISVIGLGKTSLDPLLQSLAESQGRTVVGDLFPDRGHYYRSDQFSFAKVGIPSVYTDTGNNFMGRPAEWGKQQIETFEEKHYHQVSDELRPEWDLSGALEDTELLFYLGLHIANAAEMPSWKAGDEFEAVRKKALTVPVFPP